MEGVVLLSIESVRLKSWAGVVEVGSVDDVSYTCVSKDVRRGA